MSCYYCLGCEGGSVCSACVSVSESGLSALALYFGSHYLAQHDFPCSASD